MTGTRAAPSGSVSYIRLAGVFVKALVKNLKCAVLERPTTNPQYAFLSISCFRPRRIHASARRPSHLGTLSDEEGISRSLRRRDRRKARFSFHLLLSPRTRPDTDHTDPHVGDGSPVYALN